FSPPLNLSQSRAGDGKGRINRDIWHNGSLDLAIGPDGVIYAAWTAYEGDLWVSASTNGGRSFSSPQPIGRGNNPKPARAPALATGLEGTVYLAWTTGEDNTADIHLCTSSDRGATFGSPRVAVRTPGYSDAPKLAVDEDGTVHLAFAEGSGGPFEVKEIWYTRSNDSGQTFAAPRNISRAGRDMPRSAGFPSLYLAQKAQFVVLWELFPQAGGRPRGLGLTVSSDGGQTFTKPMPVPESNDAEGGVNGSLQGLLMKKLATNNRGEVGIINSSFIQNEKSRVWLMRGRLKD
ncbi:MAG TPA: sialidase family protein, partial [Clostridia bacterium]|nr:sialidase family protein [Clostridia bacterium]